MHKEIGVTHENHANQKCVLFVLTYFLIKIELLEYVVEALKTAVRVLLTSARKN